MDNLLNYELKFKQDSLYEALSCHFYNDSASDNAYNVYLFKFSSKHSKEENILYGALSMIF